MTLLDRIKQEANLNFMSLKDVAEKSGLNEKSMYAWDKSSPKVANLEKVAKTLNVSVDYLLGNIPSTTIIKFAYNNVTHSKTDEFDEIKYTWDTYSLLEVKRQGIVVNPSEVTILYDNDDVFIDGITDEISNGEYEVYCHLELTYGDLKSIEFNYKRYNNIELDLLVPGLRELQKRLKKRSLAGKHVDLLELVNDVNRDSRADANGKQIQNNDWDMISRVLSKYRDQDYL